MPESAPRTAGTTHSTIPVCVSAGFFLRFVLPCLSMPKRGPRSKIEYLKIFNYILKVLYTGMQWKEMPIANTADGMPEIHYTRVYTQASVSTQETEPCGDENLGVPPDNQNPQPVLPQKTCILSRE